MSMQAFSGLRELLRSEMMIPAVENTLSDGTDVAGAMR